MCVRCRKLVKKFINLSFSHYQESEVWDLIVLHKPNEIADKSKTWIEILEQTVNQWLLQIMGVSKIDLNW